jgi:hypothetical protein
LSDKRASKRTRQKIIVHLTDRTLQDLIASDRVKPIGHAVANQILTKAFKACGILNVRVKELTGS